MKFRWSLELGARDHLNGPRGLSEWPMGLSEWASLSYPKGGLMYLSKVMRYRATPNHRGDTQQYYIRYDDSVQDNLQLKLRVLENSRSSGDPAFKISRMFDFTYRFTWQKFENFGI